VTRPGRAAASRVGVKSARGYASKGSADKAAKRKEWCEGSAGPTGDREVRSTMQKAVVHKVVRGGAGGGGVSDTVAAPTSVAGGHVR